VGDQGDGRSPAGDRLDLADEAVTGHDRLLLLDPVVTSLVDRDGRVPDRRRAGDHARGHRIDPLWIALVPRQPDESAELLGVARSGRVLRELLTELANLALQLLVVALRGNHVTGPADQVPERLERAVHTRLDRREGLLRPPLDRVQPAAGRLAEVGGQQHERHADEYGESRPAPADRPAGHWGHGPLLSSVSTATAGVLAAPVDRFKFLERATRPDRHAG